MSFVVAKKGTPRIVRNWPVIIPTAQDGGEISQDEITVDYEQIAQSEIDNIILAASRAGESDSVALLRRAVKTINGQVDEDNNPIPFNEETFAEALDRPNQRVAMVNAFFDVHHGRKAARKNS